MSISDIRSVGKLLHKSINGVHMQCRNEPFEFRKENID